MKKILVIEDDPAISQGLSKFLEDHAYQVIVENHGDRGYERALTEPIDLLLLDLMLPGKNGLDICRDLRSAGVNFPIIMITSKADEVDKVAGLYAGADDYVTKPFGVHELLARIQAMLRRMELRTGVTAKVTTQKEIHEEVRIFMFLDMKDSTTIAENIGHIKFFNLLNDFFYDSTEPILKSKGEIYQYVGDEITVSWNLPDGIQNANCINCFFDILGEIESKSEKYKKNYNRIPQFKAGIHYGAVSVGVVGFDKKEVIYSGDVLNTTSRIQELCNSNNEKLLLSEGLLNLLSPAQKYSVKKIGTFDLRGKRKQEVLYAVRAHKR